MFVIDSNILIDLIENKKDSEEIRKVLNDEPLITTSICMQEVLAGADSGKRVFILSGIFSAMRVLNHDHNAAIKGATIERELKKQGIIVGRADVMIAAICQTHSMELLTRDKDFLKIKGLKVKVI